MPQLSLARTRVARRILTLFLLVAVLPTIGLSVYVMGQATGELEQQSLIRQRQNTKVLAMSVVARLDEFDRRLRTARLNLVTARASVNDTAFAWTALGRAEGVVVSTLSGPQQDELPALSADDQARLSSGRAVLRVGAGADARTILLARAVDSASVAGGVIWAAVDARGFWSGSWTDAAAPTEGGFCVTAGKNRMPLYCSWSPLGEFISREAHADALDASRLEWTHDGERYLGSAWPLFLGFEYGAESWQVTMAEPRSRVLASVIAAQRLLWPAVAFGLLVVFVLVHRLLGQSLEPLAELKSGTLRLAQRQFDQPIQVKSRDEFGDLAASFNQMAGDLGRHFDLLAAIGDIQGVALAGSEPEHIGDMLRQAVNKSIPGGATSLVLPDKAGAAEWSAYGGGGRVRHSRLSAGEMAELLRNPHHLYLESGVGARSYIELGEGDGDRVVLPLFERTEVAGAIVVALRSGQVLDDQDLARMRQLADSAAVALGSSRLLLRLRELSWGALGALARTVDANSPWTAGHSERVTNFALTLGRRLGLNETELDNLHRGGLLHDIGKVGVPAAILDKPGPLTAEERERVNAHPVVGARILAPMDAFTDILPIVRHHHEWYNGKGYPDKLAGDAIPWLVRIISVADVFDALVSDRPYRQGMSLEDAAQLIHRAGGSQFDPRVVAAFGDVIHDPPTMELLGLTGLQPQEDQAGPVRIGAA